MELAEIIGKTAEELLEAAVTRLPRDVIDALENARKSEESETARKQLEAILENVSLAARSRTPMCQDTGVILFFALVGNEFPMPQDFKGVLAEATRKATKDIPLRPNTVHPLTRRNTGDNTGTNMPHVSIDVADGEFLELTAVPKGAGCENMSYLSMLTPAKGLLGIKEFVLDSVVRSGGQPCPPTVIGIGIGGSADIAAELSKKAIFRPLNKRHPEPQIASLEKELLEAVNSLGIGPMGLGGRTTALGLNIEYAHCHTASLPVAFNTQCWAARSSSARIASDGKVEWLTAY